MPVTKQILDLIFELRNLPEGERANAAPIHREKVQAFVNAGQPVHMILPAFPAKSPNPRKTVSRRPDYGEVLALQRLNELCARIGEVYAPGARITICSDGRVFSDVVHVSDGDVDIYGREIERILREHGLQHLSTFNLEDVFGEHTFDDMRRALVEEFAEDLERVRENVKGDFEARALFNGIHRFMFEDQLVLQPALSKNGAREHAKGLAYEVIRRSNAWSRLVEARFPEAVRLSIHPQAPLAAKIGVRLLPSDDAWRTPWHSVAVFDGQRFFLAPRAQAEERGAMLSYADDKYPYFLLQEAEAVS